MKTKTSTLIDAALNWAVEKALGTVPKDWNASYSTWKARDYSTNWARGGPIIEREGITVSKTAHGFWESYKRPSSTQDCYQVDDIPLIAAMRCYVASKLGDEVEIPEELK